MDALSVLRPIERDIFTLWAIDGAVGMVRSDTDRFIESALEEGSEDRTTSSNGDSLEGWAAGATLAVELKL